jgi:hypothetical protein
MTLTLAWKEMREHQGIWLTMAFMTVLMGWGLGKIVALSDPGMAVPTAAFTIFAMAAAYGIVCGAMMFAGEHEGGTLVFLDIFLGRRGRLWAGKVAIGTVLVLTESLTVAAVLNLLQHEPPGWALALVGYGDANRPAFRARLDPGAWFLVLPVMALEAYAWGLLGSSLTKRVLAGAAIAAVGFTPVWLFSLLAPSPCFLTLRLVLAIVLLAFSLSNFLKQSEDAAPRPSRPERRVDPKEQFLERWDEFEDDDIADERPAYETPANAHAAYPTVALAGAVDEPIARERPARTREPELEEAKSPSEVLWWLTLQQAWPLFWTLAGVALVIGFIVPANGQVLWPLMTLLLGVACGVAAFAPEQRDLSYQFLSAQHFPLQTIWRFKILFWLAVAVIEALVMAFGSLFYFAVILVQRPRVDPPAGLSGTFRDLMGPLLFFGVWLLYGFSTGQLVVWFCRKNILALLVSFLVAATALGMWLPSLLCGGMNGWQLWAPPLILFLAGWFLMRAWAGGRIMERKPLAALAGFGAAILVWALLNFGYRAWECPDVGAPLDRAAFRASLPADKDNAAAKAIHKAIVKIDEWKRPPDRADRPLFFENERWADLVAEASALPVGVLETPRADGQSPLLKHLPSCQKISSELLWQARWKQPGPALNHLVEILVLSRNLRNKAPLQSYLAGIQMEEDALNGLDLWLARGKPDHQHLRRVVDELNRHASETPPPLDCLHTECFRSSGAVANPNTWTMAAPERWLAGSIALSLEAPWEAERKTRIWQLVWGGLFRAVDTPHWQLPELSEVPKTKKKATREILQCWLPAPGASISRADMIHLLDTSWLADDRLFCPVVPLREAAIRARWRVDATRLAVALSLYRLEEGKSAPDLEALVPKYLPAGLPIDPYSGQPFGYRILPQNGQAIVWSTGPDRVDHGGKRHGGHLADDDPQWVHGNFDLIKSAPQWP